MVSYKRALQIKTDRQPTILEELGLDKAGYKQLSDNEQKILRLINKINKDLQVDHVVASLYTLEEMVKHGAELIHDDVSAELASFARQGIDVKNAASLNFAYCLLEERYHELGGHSYAGKLARVKALATREETFTGIAKRRSSALRDQLENVLETEARKVEEYLTGSLREVLNLAAEILPFVVNVEGYSFRIESAMVRPNAVVPMYSINGDSFFQRTIELYSRAIIGSQGIKIYDPKVQTNSRFQKDQTIGTEGNYITIGSPLHFPLIEFASPQNSLDGFYGIVTPFPVTY